MAINLKEIEQKVKPLGGKSKYDKEFIFDLLTAFGRAPANITRLRNGQLNIANDKQTDVAQKNVVYFKPTEDSVYAVIDELKTNPTVVRYSTRFVIVTDYKKLLAIDTKTNEPLDIDIRDINKHYAFFLPWAGMEKSQFVNENHADVKASEKMAKLFDELIACNGFTTPLEWHTLTIFFTRILFCFFAEDTGIFKENQFANIIRLSQDDGVDLHEIFNELFQSLNAEDKTNFPEHFASFPYVNGNLFGSYNQIPMFNAKSREIMIECSSGLDWSDINPDIFGSMFQAVVRPGQRSGLGQHYTSVPNIMKTIEPLFLDGLKEEFTKYYESPKKLVQLLKRISKIKVLDPACGSGNFLIIAYKELRRLENAIWMRFLDFGILDVRIATAIKLENFYGIEIDDFAYEIAILSLIIASHQMNIEFNKQFKADLKLIPLKDSAKIIKANATRIDWNTVCPNKQHIVSDSTVKEQTSLIPNENEQPRLLSNEATKQIEWDEIYLIGNPPYQGSKLQNANQKADYKYVFEDESYSKNLDYIALWFIKGARYIANTKAELAFVTTNSVSQGEHVGLMFPKIFNLGLEIGFAYTSFKWENNAKHNAGVTVSVIGLRNKSSKPKYIFTEGVNIEVNNINGYLTDSDSAISIERRSRPISNLPVISFGSMLIDGGNLVLDNHSRKAIIEAGGQEYVKSFIGSAELIRGVDRWCLFIDDINLSKAKTIPLIEDRLEKVKKFRRSSKRGDTAKLADTPNRFGFVSYKPTNSIIIPRVSSERRDYIPIGYLGKDTIIADSAFAVYDAAPYVFGLISSHMHMVWVRAVAGQLETRIRYSSAIVYNNFPVPPLSDNDKANIEEKVFGVMDARENHPEKTLAEMYDPDKMPDDLRLAHQHLDEIVDDIYSKKPFNSDEERLSYLFDLYEQMTANERKVK
jgi:type I restriction-modification system DNA methylase subunit